MVTHSETPANATNVVDALLAAYETVRTMVHTGGCAWHADQTHASLTPFLIEETAEFIDAIERDLPAAEVASELGDVLYQVLFHSVLAERDGEGYDLAAVAAGLNAKLIARHPHVFADRGYMSVDELNAEWERLKEDAAGEARGSRGALEGIPAGMPTLARSAKVIERLKRAGALDAGGSAPSERSEAEIGADLLALVREANRAGVDPDRALRIATNSFATERLAAAGESATE